MTEAEAYARCAHWMRREIQQRLKYGDTLRMGHFGDQLARRYYCNPDATIGWVLDRLEQCGKETQYPEHGWGGFVEVHPWWDMVVKGFGATEGSCWDHYLEVISGVNLRAWLDRAKRMWTDQSGPR